MPIFIFIALMIGIFYFLLIRPQRRRQAEHKGFVEALKPGDKVITIGGLYGEIAEIDGAEIILTVEDGGRLRFLRSSIMGMQQSAEVEEIEEAEVVGEVEGEAEEVKDHNQ